MNILGMELCLNKKTFSLLTLSIWLFCILSLMGIHFYRGRKSSPKEFVLKGRAIFQGLSDEEKTHVARSDTAIIRLNGDNFRMIGLGHELEEKQLIESNEIAIKRIDFRINDRILLERQFMVQEAYRSLNDAEKKCINDHYATIIYRDGVYFLCLDQDKHAEYAIKFGTGCTTCNEQQNQTKTY